MPASSHILDDTGPGLSPEFEAAVLVEPEGTGIRAFERFGTASFPATVEAVLPFRVVRRDARQRLLCRVHQVFVEAADERRT